MPLEIKEGAILVADAHWGPNRPDFLPLLEKIEFLRPPQLFLLGDMVDLLIPPLPCTLKQNKKIIEKIEELSKTVEIHYFEGNHDYLLDGLWSNVAIYTMQMQPVAFLYKDKIVLLSHGDSKEGDAYDLYSKLIRNRFIVYLLHICTFNFLGGWFVRRILKKQLQKQLCGRKISNFKSKIIKKLSLYPKSSFVVEGHYHQGESFDANGVFYYNISAFACNKSFFQVESKTDDFALAEHKF